MSEPLLLLFEGLLLCGLICLSAFFSSSEIALFSMGRAKLMAFKDDPSLARRRVHLLMKDYHLTLISIILANMFVNSCLSMVNDELLGALKLSPLLTSLLSAFVGIVILLLFGEITPMSIAYIHAERWSEKVATPIWYLRKALYPVVIAVGAVCDKVLDALGRRKPKPLDQEEYLSYLDTCLARNACPEWEAKLLRHAFALREKTVEEVMRARVQLPFIKSDASPETVAETIRKSKLSQILVGEETLESAERLLSARAFFLLDKTSRREWWSSNCVRPAVVIPSGTSLVKALKALDAKSAHAGIVCDEYGGISGMILRQDIYAELVGRAGEDEDGSSGWKAFKSDDGAWIFDGLCPLSFVKESAGWEPAAEPEANTIGGYLSEALGKFPSKGETLEFEDVSLKANAIARNRVGEVELRFKPKREAPPESATAEERTE